MIRIEGASLTVGDHDLLDDAELHIRPDERIGLVGRNGAGKTSLLRALLGQLDFSGGQVQRRRGLRIGYLPQAAVSGSTLTVWDEVRTGATRLVALQQQLERAQAAADRRDPGGVEALAAAQSAFEVSGGYAWDRRVGTVLHGLGFDKELWLTPCDQLSGGWQMRTALARMLLSEPDIAFLDEPTNHLDLHARGWLAEALRVAPWTTVIVSHDRYLLDHTATRIVEVRNRRLYSWPGNFSQFLRDREALREQQLAARDKQDAEIAHLQSFVDRFGAKATKARQAQSRAKRLDKIERIEIDSLAPPPRIHLPEPPASAQRMLRLADATIGWTAEAPIVTGLELELERGMRLALVGDNGVGKSTLLASMAGSLPLLAGRRLPGDRVRMGVFHQDLAASLPGEQTALEHVTEAAPTLPTARVRAVLGALGLSGDHALRPLAQLSGGEKARVALAALTVRPHNLLFLDEPTNHLDAETVDVLVDALSAWTGALVLVSHDRYVVERLATHVLRMAPPWLVDEGVRPEHFERTAGDDGEGVDRTKRVDHADRKRLQRELERAQRRLDDLPAALEQAEAEVARVDAALFEHAEDWARAAALGDERSARQAEVDALYAEWEQLEERIDALTEELA